MRIGSCVNDEGHGESPAAPPLALTVVRTLLGLSTRPIVSRQSAQPDRPGVLAATADPFGYACYKTRVSGSIGLNRRS
jgi:hypothetical protein